MKLDTDTKLLVEAYHQIYEANREGFPSQQEVSGYLAKFYPFEDEQALFEDNWGLYSQHPNSTVKRILLCTTATDEVIQQFKAGRYDLLISHHDNLKGVSQIIFHSIMDESIHGHNAYFAKRMGLQNVQQKVVTVEGNLYKPLMIGEFKDYLIKHGFKINGMVYSNPRYVNEPFQSVIYCSGLGGMLINRKSLKSMKWSGNPNFDLRRLNIDVYVTGQLLREVDPKNTNFKHVIELGHTSSEKPLFKWIKNQLKNRWINLQVDLASDDIDYFGQDWLAGNQKSQEIEV